MEEWRARRLDRDGRFPIPIDSDWSECAQQRRITEVKIRTLIVDDEPLGRERIRTLLGGDEEIEVVGESGDGRQAILAIEKFKPDLVFLDVQMPELDGFAVLDMIASGQMPFIIF